MLQRSRALTIDDVKIFMTPRKLVRSLQNSAGDNSQSAAKQEVEVNVSPASSEVKWYPTVGDERRHKKTSQEEAGSVIDDTESVSSTNALRQGSAQEESEEFTVGTEIEKEITKKTQFGKAAVSFIWGILFIIMAIVLLAMRIDNDEGFYGIVPT